MTLNRQNISLYFHFDQKKIAKTIKTGDSALAMSINPKCLEIRYSISYGIYMKHLQAFNKAAIWWISHSSELSLDGIFNISISYLGGFRDPRSEISVH
jgi:hypothetical protein